MINMLKSWKGAVEINGTHYNSISDIKADLSKENNLTITLLPTTEKDVKNENNAIVEGDNEHEVVITVKKYMTKKATPEFDFMAKWNNDEPMPLRTMVGHKIKETRGMVYMELHGDIIAERTCTCMACGRKLTNPVSQYFGIGPECGNHNYINPFDTEEELKNAVENYRKELQSKTWTGWIIKSAITDVEEFKR